MIRRGFLGLLFAAGLAAGAAAAEDAGTLVIEVGGSVEGTIEIALDPAAPQRFYLLQLAQ